MFATEKNSVNVPFCLIATRINSRAKQCDKKLF